MVPADNQRSRSQASPLPHAAVQATSQFRAGIAAAMSEAAGEAKRTINTDRMVITTRDDIFVANAPISEPPDGASIFEYPMFVYLGFAGTPCENTIRSGFYTIRVVSDPKDKVPQAHYIDAAGNVALVNSVTLETRPGRYDVEEDLLKVGITLRSTEVQGQAGIVIAGSCRCVRHERYGWVIVHTVVI